MNICVLGLRGFPHVMGGVETHCEQLFPLLKTARPHDSFIVLGRRRYLPQREAQFLGLKVVALPHATDRRLETITNALYGVFYARFAAQADLLHVQGIGAAIVVPIGKLLGMKVVVTYHSKNYEHKKWSWAARASLRCGELFAICCSDYVVSVSRSIEADLIKRFPRRAHKIQFIPNGADHACSSLAAETLEAKISENRLERGQYIISVGRLVPEKGFHDLIDAFCSADIPNFKLVLVGEADHPDGYSRRLRARASDKVVFTGFLPRACIYSLLRDASLFVLPSYNEGTPIAALEAVIAGCPVLLSDIEQNRSLGLAPQNYFPVGSVDDLRRRLTADHAGYRVDPSEILQDYNWKSACERMDELYSSIEKKLNARQPKTRRRQVRLLPATIWHLKWHAEARVPQRPDGTGSASAPGHDVTLT